MVKGNEPLIRTLMLIISNHLNQPLTVNWLAVAILFERCADTARDLARTQLGDAYKCYEQDKQFHERVLSECSVVAKYNEIKMIQQKNLWTADARL